MAAMEQRKSVPRFFLKAIEDKAASDAAGHPVFIDVEYIEVRHPGAQHSVPCCKVKQEHKDFYHEAYAAFKRGEEAPLDGFPITEWAPISRASAETLKAMGVFTVENLANVTDTSAQHMPTEFQSLRVKAKRFLEEHNSEQGQINTLKAENKTLMERLEKLEALSENKEEPSEDTPEPEKEEPRNSDSGRRKAKPKG